MKIISFSIIILFLICNCGISAFSLNYERINQYEEKNDINILIMVPSYFGALGYRAIDIFNDYGWNITLTGLNDVIFGCNGSIQYWNIPPLKMDYLISDISDISFYDALCIMQPSKWTVYPDYGDPGRDLMNSEEALNLISSANDFGITIAAWCAGVRVLAAADVINGKNVTGPSEFIEEYTNAGGNFVNENTYPVVDGNIITVSGMRFIIDMCEEVALSIEENIISNNPSKLDIETFNKNNNEIDEQQSSEFLEFWNITVGGLLSDGARSIDNTIDGGFIISGYTFSYGAGKSDVFLIKTDEVGNVIWEKTYGSNNSDYGNSVIQTSDGGYIITGSSCNDFSNKNKDLLLIKTDHKGTVEWIKTFGGSKDDEGFSVCETIDNGLIITGYSKNESTNIKEIFLIKTDYEGNSQWIKSYRGSYGTSRGNFVCQTSDEGFIIAGSTGASSDGYIIKTDEFGNVIWNKRASTTGLFYSWGISICQLSDDNIIFMGYGRITNSDILNVFIEKRDIDGNLIWSNSFGESPCFDYGTALLKTYNDNVILCGKTRNGDSDNDLFICEIETIDGNIVWKELFGLSGNDCANSICISTDGSIIVAGYTNSIGSGDFDVLLTKILRVDNNIPNIPSAPTGRTSGKTGDEYIYSTSTIDVDGDDIYYLFDWGNGLTSFIQGPYISNEECKATNIWYDEGSYEVRVKAIDEHGAESEWSDPLIVTMPRAKTFNQIPRILVWLFDRFPFLQLNFYFF